MAKRLSIVLSFVLLLGLILTFATKTGASLSTQYQSCINTKNSEGSQVFYQRQKVSQPKSNESIISSALGKPPGPSLLPNFTGETHHILLNQ